MFRCPRVPLPQTLTRADLERSMQAGLKRFSRGFLKTVALHTPPAPPSFGQFGMPQGAGGPRFSWLRDVLAEEHNVTAADLTDGRVPDEADILVVAAPKDLDETQVFAIDQFLMQGGTVILATAPFDIQAERSLAATRVDSGLADWLKHHGLEIADTLVLDPQNAAFPIPVERNLGGFVVRETQLVDYPYFVDVRDDGIDEAVGLTAGLGQVTLTWASPITPAAEQPEGRTVTPLLHSTDRAWTSDSLDIQPDFEAHGRLGFEAGDARGRQLLAVVAEGRFESYFKDQPSPLITAVEAQPDNETPMDPTNPEAAEPQEAEQEPEQVIGRVIDHSPASARIILFASNSFINDEMLDLAAAGLGTRYLKPVELIENAIDWSLEERGLLAIRGRAQFSRILDPLDTSAQVFWEYLNYLLAILGVVLVWFLHRQLARAARARHAAILAKP